MPEFVNTGKGMQLVETNNASQVPFQQGNLIIEDSGSIYYDPTNKTDVSGRITVGKANEIINLGTVDMPLNPRNPEAGGSNEVLADITNQGIYKYNYIGPGGTYDEYLIVTMGGMTITQVRFADGSIYTRISSPDELSTTNWTYYAEIGDVDSLEYDIAALDTRVTNAETKLSTVYKYKGSSTVANLPTSNQETGDVYNLTDGGTINSGGNEETVVAGDNVAWTGDYWDKLAGTIEVEPSISEYDTVITSQEEWDTMVASSTWNDAVNILLKVDRITNATATIPNNVKKIVGCSTNYSRPYIVGSLTGSADGNVQYPNNVSLSNIIIDMGNNLSNVNLVENCMITGKLSNFNTAINTSSYEYTNGQNIFNCIINATSTTAMVNNVKRIVGLKCIDISGNLKPIQYTDCEYVIEATGELLDLTTTAKTDLVSAINELSDNTIKIINYNQSYINTPPIPSDFAAVTTSGIYKISSAPEESDSRYLGQLFVSSDGDSSTGPINTGVYQILFSHQGHIYERRITTDNSTPDWSIVGEGGEKKKYFSIVIGNSASGHTADEVDYLYEAGSDFGSVLSSAISKLTGSGAKGGEIKILRGTYTLTSAVTTSGTSTAPIKITGEGKSTIITSVTPTSSYINACCCEISECKLETDITITTNGSVNIHDCEIGERIYINNPYTIQGIFIHDNNLMYSYDEDCIYLSGSGGIYNFQVYNNYAYLPDGPFDFLHVAADQTLYYSSISNNYCPDGELNFNTYTLDGDHSTISGNYFSEIDLRGGHWIVSNNQILNGFYLRGGNYLDIINNDFKDAFAIYSGITYVNIVHNMIATVSSPYINLGTNARFVNNVIRDTNFSTTYIPGYDTTSNKWGNNMWANGFDRLIFANEEEIGGNQ